jgi:hypothetical protein
MRRTRLAAVGTDPRETGVGKPSAHTSCTSVPEAYKEAALAALTTNVVPLTGLRFDNLLTAAAGGGDDCEAAVGVYLVVRNLSGGNITVTLAVPELIDGDLVITSRAVVVPLTTGMTLIPVTQRYRNPTTGRAAITYSGVTSLTVCVIRTAVS